MSDLLDLLVRHGYLVIFAVILLENLGLPLPGMALLIVAGGAAAAGKFSVALIVALTVLAALLGDLVWYALGRWRGRPVLGFLCRLSLNPDTCVSSTERFFLRHGMRSLLVAKFLPGLNTVAPPLMGTLRARLGPFLAYDAGGAVIFAVIAVGAGYSLGFEMVNRAQMAASQVGLWVAWAALAFGAVYVGWRLVSRLRVKKALRTVGLSPTELRREQEGGGSVVVVDVRSPLALGERPVRIPGAIHATQEELGRLAAAWPREQRIVTYCV